MAAEKWTEGPSGYLELIDCETSTVIARQIRCKAPRKRHGSRGPGRPSKAELARVSSNPNEPVNRLYDPALIAEKICDALASGVEFIQLGTKHNCPSPTVINRLKRENSEFARRLQSALEVQKLARSDALEQRLIELLKDVKRSAHSGAVNLEIEIYMLLAELNDPDTYRFRCRRGRPRRSLLLQRIISCANL